VGETVNRSADETHESPDVVPDEAGLVPAGVWCELGSARATIADAIRASVDQLVAELPRARAGDDPEGVHQARVATRRLRSDLRTFGPLLDDDWRVATRAELKWLADALGAVRDADVLAMHLDDAIEPTGADPAAASTVLSALEGQRAAARRALIRVLDDQRATSLLDELGRRADDPPTTPSALGRAELRLRPLVRQPWRKLARTVDRLGDEPTVEQLHRVRLLSKRTRYAAEAVVPVYGREARRFAAAVKEVQDVLGEMNDAAAAVRWLGRTGAALDAPAAFAAGQLAHHFRTVAEQHRHGWERAFERARRRAHWLE
jgi:CHAD domain-containing protein